MNVDELLERDLKHWDDKGADLARAIWKWMKEADMGAPENVRDAWRATLRLMANLRSHEAEVPVTLPAGPVVRATHGLRVSETRKGLAELRRRITPEPIPSADPDRVEEMRVELEVFRIDTGERWKLDGWRSVTASQWISDALEEPYHGGLQIAGDDYAPGTSGIAAEVESVSRELGWDALDTLALLLMDQQPPPQPVRVFVRVPWLSSETASEFPVIVVELFTPLTQEGWEEMLKAVEGTWESLDLTNRSLSILNRVVMEETGVDPYVGTGEKLWMRVKSRCEEAGLETKTWQAWMVQWRRENADKVRRSSMARDERRGRPPKNPEVAKI